MHGLAVIVATHDEVLTEPIDAYVPPVRTAPVPVLRVRPLSSEEAELKEAFA